MSDTVPPTASNAAIAHQVTASQAPMHAVSIQPYLRGLGRPGGVSARVVAVHSGQWIISYHNLSLGLTPQGIHLAPEPSSVWASRHLFISHLYLAFLDIIIHSCFGTESLGDHTSGFSSIFLLSQNCGDRVYILQHQAQNLKRSLGIHPCMSLGRRSYEL
jgi:hypothetical protein